MNGASYNVRTYFNEYAAMWFLDLLTIDDVPIAMGIALVPNINLFSFDDTLTNEIGQLRVADTNGDGNSTTESLGTTSILYYFFPGEFESLYPDYDSQDYRPQQFDFYSLFTLV